MPDAPRTAYLVGPEDVELLHVLGPTVEVLTPPGADDAPCVLRGSIPPGGSVPLHSHADVETFLPLSGEVEGLTERAGRLEWIPVRPGDVFHVPGGARHAWRNRGREPAVTIIATTSRIARFFREVATPPGPASEADVRRFLEVSARYGYWNATPEENAAVGLPLAGA